MCGLDLTFQSHWFEIKSDVTIGEFDKVSYWHFFFVNIFILHRFWKPRYLDLTSNAAKLPSPRLQRRKQICWQSAAFQTWPTFPAVAGLWISFSILPAIGTHIDWPLVHVNMFLSISDSTQPHHVYTKDSILSNKWHYSLTFKVSSLQEKIPWTSLMMSSEQSTTISAQACSHSVLPARPWRGHIEEY